MKQTASLVSNLKPNKVIPLNDGTNIFQAAAYMAAKRQEAVLIVNAEGELTGILTDKDLAYRVVAEDLNPEDTIISSDTAIDALNKMIAGKFRHLPVIQESFEEDSNEEQKATVFSVLDITKCLYEQLDKMEKAAESSQKIQNAILGAEVNLPVSTTNSVLQLANLLRSKIEFPDLESLMEVESLEVPLVPLNSTVLEAVKQMKDAKTTGILTVDENKQLAGIFTTKDLVLRVLAAKLDPATTLINRVHTPSPDYVSPSTTVLESLKKMHNNRYLHLPIVKDTVICGMADVLKLTYHMLSQLNEMEKNEEPGPLWNKFWEQASQKTGSDLRSDGMPNSSYFQYSDVDSESIAPDDSASMITPTSSVLKAQVEQQQDEFVFKFKDEVANKTSRFTSNIRDLDAIKVFVANKVFQTYGGRFDKNNIHLCYLDDDEDFVHLASNRDLEDAILLARASGWRSLVIMLDRNKMQFHSKPIREQKFTIEPERTTIAQQIDIFFPVAAVLLTAIEESIQEQGEQLVPMAYFGTIMTIVDQSFEGDSSIIPAAVYILSVVFPSISSNILRLKFVDISTIFEKVISTFNDDAPTVINCYEYLLFAQENIMWNSESSCRKSFQYLLGYSVDARPKVRKRAVDAIKRILSNPPPPSLTHPGTIFAIDFYFNVIDNFQLDKSSNKAALESQTTDALVNLKMLIPTFAMQSNNDKIRSKFDKLCSALLKLPSRAAHGHNVLTQWSFEVFSSLLSPENINEIEFKVLYSLTKALLDLSPYENDAILTPLWLTVITYCYSRLSEVVCDFEIGKIDSTEEHIQRFANSEYPKLVSSLFEKIFKTVFDSNVQIKPIIIEKATVLLSSLFDTCVSDGMIKNNNTGGNLDRMIGLVDGSLNNIRYRDYWGNILNICAAIFKRLATEHSHLVAQLLEKIFIIRDDKGYGSNFPYKVEMDSLLEIAIQNLGFQVFSSHISMNIENEYPGQPRRPYLLAILCKALESAHSTSEWHAYKVYGTHSLKYYFDELLPLADRLLKKSGELWEENRQLEAKLFETLGLQIWSSFPSLCATLPEDTSSTFGQLAKRLGKVLTTSPKELYPNLPSGPDLRPTVCQGLENIIESFYLFATLKEEEGDDQDKLKWKEMCSTIGKDVISKVQKYVNRFLSAICNIYTSVDLEDLQANKHRGQTLQSIHEKTIQTLEKTIKKLLLIADANSISEYFITMAKTVSRMVSNPNPSEIDRLTSYAIFDLVLILIPHIPKENFVSTLVEFQNICTSQIQSSDSTLQKKSYKCLSAILGAVPIDSFNVVELSELLLNDNVVTKISPGAIRPRMKLLQRFVELISDTQVILHFIPSALPEVMLATKESNEKTRDCAYDCLIAMCKKMMLGNGAANTGLDRAFKSLDIEENNVHTPEISIKEFLMMVVAGLGGSSSHMQSASIASLGRLVFEFSSLLDIDLTLELLKTVVMCMSFKNREVTKAALGFIKVAIVCLPEDVLETCVESIVKSILEHTREHKSHFKSKARHIFERLIRKFTYEKVEQYFPEQDRKLIANIKKRRDALKKRKSQAVDEDIAEETKVQKPNAKPAKSFEKAFHDSDSELDSDEDYIPEQFKDELSNHKQIKTETLIHEGDIDFLDTNVVSRLTQSKAKKSKKAIAAKTNEDGRLVFEDSDDEKEEAKPEISEDYYKQSLASEVAFTRTADGRVKFIKRKRMEEDNGEVEETKDVGQRWNAGKKKAKTDQSNVDLMLGRQYKAKKARGDVKRPGMADPHSYIPLTGKIVGNMNKSTKIDGNLKGILKAAVKGTDAGVKARKISNAKGISKANKKHK
ncbi:hypothetical protein HDV06_003560 [Boothiomyces sp. JEL0866]|nr:hypothetical protein HDV06_003560 [Boothiomyces sp. JEL0866]